MTGVKEEAGICKLIEPLINSKLWIDEFIENDLKHVVKLLSDICLFNKALSVLLGDGVKLGEIEDSELREKLLVAVLGGIKEGDKEEELSFANFMRRVFGVGIARKEGSREIISSTEEVIEYVKIHNINEIVIVKNGGAIEKICALIDNAKSLCRYLTSKPGYKSEVCDELKLGSLNSEGAEEIVKRILPFRDDKELKPLNELLSKLRKALAILSIGSNKFLTSAYIVRFIPVRVLSEHIGKCSNVEGGRLCKMVKDIIDFLGLKIFDLGRNMFRNINEIGCDELIKDFLVTIHETYYISKPWERYNLRRYFSIKSRIYSFIYYLKRIVSKAETLIFEDSIINKTYREFIMKNVKVLSGLIYDHYRKLLTEILSTDSISFSACEGMFFKKEQIEKILAMYPLVALGLYDVSIGLDVVYAGRSYNAPYYWHHFVNFYCLDREVHYSCNLVKEVLREADIIEQRQ